MILKIEKVPGLQNLYHMKKIDTGRKNFNFSFGGGTSPLSKPKQTCDRSRTEMDFWIFVLKYYDMYNIFSEILSCMHILEKDLKLIE